MTYKNTVVQGWAGGYDQSVFLSLGLGGSNLTVWVCTYFMDGPFIKTQCSLDQCSKTLRTIRTIEALDTYLQ